MQHMRELWRRGGLGITSESKWVFQELGGPCQMDDSMLGHVKRELCCWPQIAAFMTRLRILRT